MIRCTLFGHKFVKTNTTHRGGYSGSSREWVTVTSPDGKLKVKINYCYRCELYIPPALSLRHLEKLGWT